MFFAGIIVPSDDPNLLTAKSKTGLSPWTIAFLNAGVPAGAHLVNVVMITAQLSSMNSALYVASRSLVTLASTGRAPAIFARTTSNGTPVYALVLSNALGLIAILNYKAGPGVVFGYLISISGAATFVAWAIIGIVHLRFRRAWKIQGYGTEDLHFRALLYPYGTIFVIFINTFLVFISGYSVFIDGFDVVSFVVDYVVLVVFAILYCGWKIIKRTKVVPLREVDLITGRREVLVHREDVRNEDEKPKKPWYAKMTRTFFA